jgi:acid phosphatase
MWFARRKRVSYRAARASRCLLYTTAIVLAGLLLSCGGTTGSRSASTQAQGSIPLSSHVVIVLEENKAYSEVIGNAAMPFLNGLAQQYAYSTNYFATGPESAPNYFMLTVGQPVGNNTFSGVVTDDNVVRELTAAGKSWKVYAQSLPQTGYLGASVPPYLKWHNPFVYLSDVVEDAVQQANVVPFSQFATDLANNALPDYTFIVPDIYNNSHNCPAGMKTCTLAQNLGNADNWLKENIGPLLNNSGFQDNGLLIITYDESEASDRQLGGGHVALVIAGPRVKRGFVSKTMFQHPSVLRLSMETLGISTIPGQGASAPDMGEFFQ